MLVDENRYHVGYETYHSVMLENERLEKELLLAKERIAVLSGKFDFPDFIQGELPKSKETFHPGDFLYLKDGVMTKADTNAYEELIYVARETVDGDRCVIEGRMVGAK